MAKQDIRTLTSSELKEAIVGLGEKAFRAKQIEEWLWTKGAASFEQMSNLSKGFRERLDAAFELNRIEVADQQFSSDGTIKCAFDVRAGQVVEGVLIPTSKRMTACISSQVGCSLACKFCATGRLKLLKNLSAGEIYDQVEMIRDMAKEHYNQGLTNIVYMGMGEPLLNYRSVLESVERICGDPGLAMSPKRITVSTAGIAKAIKRLGDDQVRFNLALSLHAANDEKRNRIMAINESNNLEALAEALQYFYKKTGTRVTFEYIIFRDFNDQLEDAQELPVSVGTILIGRYRVVSVIGKGSFSRVVQCYDLQTSKSVSVKVLHNDKDCVDQGIGEVRLLSLLAQRDPTGEARAHTRGR